MTDFLRWQTEDDADLYTLPTADPLGILSSTKAVVENGELVWINPEAIEALSTRWMHEDAGTAAPTLPLWDTRYHFFDGTERTVNWLLVLDALNFCFWAEKGSSRWTIEYQGETLNGYWAEAAALKHAVEDGLPLWDAEYLSSISVEAMANIFRGSGTIPLLEQRVANAREVGRVLLEHYDGQFIHAIQATDYSATRLVILLAQQFPSFYDVATYHAQPVKFFKRAQIYAADLAAAFQRQQWGALTGLEDLTIFADYKLPQVLRHAAVLSYHSTLAQTVDNQRLLEAGSEEEIEVRANTIWACELLRRALLRQGRVMTAADIDMRLWLMGQKSSEMRPYHRTRTIYY